MLRVDDIHVSVDDIDILKGLSMEIKKGEIHVVFGPNGSGKSTLAFTIMGIPVFRVKSGRIFFDGKDITELSITERAKLGIALSFQNPPEINGVRYGYLMRALNADDEILEKTKTARFVDRDLNVGLSGGEKKRCEVAQIFALKPKLLILDELDSGVDIENLKMLSKEIAECRKEFDCSILMITHHGHIMEYLKPDVGHVILDGRVVCTRNPMKIWNSISEEGYKWCKRCISNERVV